MKLLRKSTPPVDDYDQAAWTAFYEENPGWRRSVGAAGDNDDDDGEDDGKDDGKGDGGKGGDDTGDNDDAKGGKGGKPTDQEAKLLKDLMKHKAAAAAAAKEAQELRATFGDIDIDDYKRMKQEQADSAAAAEAAEQKRLLEAGEFDKVKAQMSEHHQKTVDEKDQIIAELQSKLSSKDGVIEGLTVGSSFKGSKFINEETVLTGSKARRLYGDHFDVVDGEVIGYDKPRGDQERAPIVDGDGNPVKFESAIRKIIDLDPEKDDLLRAQMKPGASSKPGDGKGAIKADDRPLTSQEKITEGLKTFVEAGPDSKKDIF